MAQNVNVNRSSPLDHLDNPGAAELMDYARASREYKPQAERPDWRVEAARGLVIGGMLVVVWLLYGLWKTAYCWGGARYAACEAINELEPLVIAGALLLAVTAAIIRFGLMTHAEYRLRQARAIRTATSFTRFGDPRRLDVPLTDADLRMYAASTMLKALTAPYEVYHAVNQFSPSYSHHHDVKSTAGAAEPESLPEPGNRLTFDAFWSRLEEAAHVGIFGMSQSGKTTLARALMHEAILRGDQVMAISLATDRVDWPIPVIGDGGEAAIVQALGAIRAELKRREDARERDGRPLRIFVDELTSATADKAVYAAWEHIMSAFMTRSRHVRMYLTVMAHDNTSGVFATTGKARLIRNFEQVWCVRENGRRIVRIDDGLTIDANGRQVRQVWQLDDTAPIQQRASRHITAPPEAIFLTEADLRPYDHTTTQDADLLRSYLAQPSYTSYTSGNGMRNVVDGAVEEWYCPHCGAQLRNRQQFSIAHRYGYCDACKP
jgi:hypothetical protein